MAAVPPAAPPLAPQVWHNTGNVAFTRGTKAYFGATIVSTMIRYSDDIANTNGGFAATIFPHDLWDNWFTAGNNPTGDFSVDPRTYTTNVSMQPATFGMTMDSARVVRECQAHCGCEIQTGQPQFRAVGTKLHFVAWTDPAAVMTSQIVCKEVIMLIASLRAGWKAWCTKIPGSHPDHVRMSRLATDMDQVRQTIRAFLFTQGPDPNSTQAFTTPALVFVALFHNTWMIIAIMDSNSRAPTHAEIVVDDTLEVF
ncbi:hypothetical protein HDU87_001903 [Geranomyces variabilis]|uniref:Uncharacterized protein n=1 Tax=Geranomyces variabilis TaxID=109894 RepID=A0AAD5TC43_9FUNG|nr:hypothetical protein HDU87_001903 [Geranomyces variabilis]